jgi:hypothetical protein
MQMRITCLLNDVLFGSVSHHAYYINVMRLHERRSSRPGKLD